MSFNAAFLRREISPVVEASRMNSENFVDSDPTQHNAEEMGNHSVLLELD
jgi:hypothetical protein